MRNCAIAGLCALHGVIALSTVAHAQVFGVELIQNAGAEAGPFSPDGYAPVASIPGWVFNGVNVVRYQTGGEFPTAGSPGPSGRGSQFFSGGNNSPFSTASQSVSVAAGASEIDTGQVEYDLRAWLGGAGTQDDTAQVAVVFNDTSGQSVGTATLTGPFASDRGGTTGMLERSNIGLVPPTTRSVTVILTMVRTNGTYNNGYADGLSMIFTAPPPSCDGDVNCDLALNGNDVEVQELAVGGDMADYCQNDPDFNGDFALNGNDVEAVEQVVGGGPCP